MPSILPVVRSLCWATHEEAERLGVGGAGTRHWAYRWIEEHVRHLARVDVLADLGGGGLDSELCKRLAPYASRVLVIDQMSQARRQGNIEEVPADLEQGLTGLPDESVDVFVTASSIEHLTAQGQHRLFTDAGRVLRPHGVFCGSISYLTRLDDHALRLLGEDPALHRIGSPVYTRFDLKTCLAGAPMLRPEFAPVSWAQFPGYEGFRDEWLESNEALVSGNVGSYGDVRCRPELDALRLKWYELGLFLRKIA